MKPFDYASPGSVDRAVQDLVDNPGARLLAGGTDLLREVRGGTASPPLLVSLRDAGGLDEIRTSLDGGLKIGARVTLAELVDHPVVRQRYAALAEACAGAATPQIRNVATLAGNLLQRPNCEYYRGGFDCFLTGGGSCSARTGDNTHHAVFSNGFCASAHPSDAAAALLALDARVTWRTMRGEQTATLASIYREPEPARPTEITLDAGCVITAVHLPPFVGRSAYLEARERQTWAFALIGVAGRLTVVEGRITEAGLALCGAAPVPWRLKQVERLLIGSEAGRENRFRDASEMAASDARPLSENGYKVTLIKGLVERILRRLTDEA